jgi:hypothetical protein
LLNLPKQCKLQEKLIISPDIQPYEISRQRTQYSIEVSIYVSDFIIPHFYIDVYWSAQLIQHLTLHYRIMSMSSIQFC